MVVSNKLIKNNCLCQLYEMSNKLILFRKKNNKTLVVSVLMAVVGGGLVLYDVVGIIFLN